MSVREVLISMGYREEQPGHWLKPIGYVLFSYHEGHEEWANWFRDVKGVLGAYERKPLPMRMSDADFLSQLKTCEAYTRTDVGGGGSEFQLSALDI